MASKIAVLGLGSMGFGMACSMKSAGLDVLGYDVAPPAVERFVARAVAERERQARP